MDLSLLHTLNQLMVHHDPIEDPLLAYVRASEYLFLAVLVAMLALAWGRARAAWRRAAVAAGLSAALALALAHVIGQVIDRPRPFVAHPALVHAFVSHAADASFPSDHATAAFAIAVAVVLRLRPAGAILLALAALLSIGRVALGLHYPSDVLAGAVLGALAALILWWTPIRTRLDALTDGAGGLADGLAERVIGRPRADASGHG